MEARHMTQQVFASYIGTTPATLSGIFNDRTRPTINIIESIKKKFPEVSLEWLMFGQGEMYQSTTNHSVPESGSEGQSSPQSAPLSAPQSAPHFSSYQQEQILDFGQPIAPTPQNVQPAVNHFNGVRPTRIEQNLELLNNVNKPLRRVTEIRVYYDDQTWESFVPAKK